MTNTYSPFDKTIFRHGFRFSAVYYPDTSTIGWTETLTGTLEAFSTITVEHMKVPVTSSNTESFHSRRHINSLVLHLTGASVLGQASISLLV